MVKKIDILSIFPEALQPYLQASLLGKAQEKGLVKLKAHDLRGWAKDKHRSIDDEVYGGGEGMVMKPEPLVAAIEELRQPYQKGRVIYLSPQGRRLTQNVAEELSQYEELLLLCGRYEGVDERVLTGWVDEEISLGDFVLCGGELAALALTEAVVRLVPGVVGKPGSLTEETFAGGLVEYPHYTRPPEFRGQKVPEVLLSGHHEAIANWRREQAVERTLKKRPDLLGKPKAPVYMALLHHPVYNAHREVVTTSITPFDLHDIARTAKTYGITKYFVVCPVASQQELAQRIMDHWLTGVGGQLNQTRKDAFQGVKLVSDLAEARLTIEKEVGRPPRLIATSAKEGKDRLTFQGLREQWAGSESPHLLMFGTGWGMTEELLKEAEAVLEPIRGGGDGSYNHLPVRGAVAIILDRLLGFRD